MSFPFNYKLGTTGVEVRLGPFVVRRIPYTDIEAVKIGYNLLNEHWTNIWPCRFLTVRRKSRLVQELRHQPGGSRQLRGRAAPEAGPVTEGNGLTPIDMGRKP